MRDLDMEEVSRHGHLVRTTNAIEPRHYIITPEDSLTAEKYETPLAGAVLESGKELARLEPHVFRDSIYSVLRREAKTVRPFRE